MMILEKAKWGMPARLASSTLLGSISTKRTSSGVLCMSRQPIMELMQTLLPLPVAPAMRRCGILERSVATGSPDTPLPKARPRWERPDTRRKAVLSMTLRIVTSDVLWFGTSMPMTGRPGTGASMRMAGAARASVRSLARAVMRFTRTRVRETTSVRYWGSPSLS